MHGGNLVLNLTLTCMHMGFVHVFNFLILWFMATLSLDVNI
jgi:hypothetical protein